MDDQSYNPNGGYNYSPKPPRRSFNGKTLVKILVILAVVIVVATVALGSFYTIGEQENAVVTTLGVPQTVTSPGLHFKIPFIQRVQKVDMTIKGFSIGYDVDSNESNAEESLMITSDFDFVNVDFFLEYRVTDPVK